MMSANQNILLFDRTECCETDLELLQTKLEDGPIFFKSSTDLLFLSKVSCCLNRLCKYSSIFCFQASFGRQGNVMAVGPFVIIKGPCYDFLSSAKLCIFFVGKNWLFAQFLFLKKGDITLSDIGSEGNTVHTHGPITCTYQLVLFVQMCVCGCCMALG